jgi:hypothetical protein
VDREPEGGGSLSPINFEPAHPIDSGSAVDYIASIGNFQ